MYLEGVLEIVNKYKNTNVFDNILLYIKQN